MGAHEAAISFLTDLEEKLEVAQVQLEIYHTVLPQASGADGAKVQLLSKRLFNITEVRPPDAYDECLGLNCSIVVPALRRAI